MIDTKYLVFIFSVMLGTVFAPQAFANDKGENTQPVVTGESQPPVRAVVHNSRTIRSTELLFLRFNNRSTSPPATTRGEAIKEETAPILLIPNPVQLPLAPVPAENYIIRYPFVFIEQKR